MVTFIINDFGYTVNDAGILECAKIPGRFIPASSEMTQLSGGELDTIRKTIMQFKLYFPEGSVGLPVSHVPMTETRPDAIRKPEKASVGS